MHGQDLFATGVVDCRVQTAHFVFISEDHPPLGVGDSANVAFTPNMKQQFFSFLFLFFVVFCFCFSLLFSHQSPKLLRQAFSLSSLLLVEVCKSSKDS